MFSNSLSSRQIDQNKAEQELVQALKKATSPEESAPKQKHVRTCIVFTQDFKSSRSFWSGMQTQALMASEVQAFKALIVIHKVIRDGHPNVLKETFNEMGFIQNLGRTALSHDNFGYGPLIRNYVDYLMTKLNFHRQNPEFPANFDYDDYLSLKGVSDPNAGYETIGQLIGLAERQDQFHRQVFRSLGGNPHNECKISCLVPLVQESFAIYTFIKSMLTAMYQTIELKDALVPLRTQFNELHESDRQFYYECSQIRYLTSLITVPELSKEPPTFLPGETNRRIEKPREFQTPPPAPVPEVSQEFILQQQREFERLQQEKQASMLDQQRMEQERLQQQRNYEEQLLLQQKREQEEFQRMQQNQMQRQVHGRIQELEQQVFTLKAMAEKAQLLYQQSEAQCQQLEKELSFRSNQSAQQEHKSLEFIRALQEQIKILEAKYENLAKLYNNTRQEHLDLLNKYKQVTSKLSSAAEAVKAMEKMKVDNQARINQLNQMALERDRAVSNLNRNNVTHQEELNKLRRDMDMSRAQLNELSQSKGAEFANLRQQTEKEKQIINQQLDAKINEISSLQSALDNLRLEQNNMVRTKDEEINSFKLAMEQSAESLKQFKSSGNESLKELQKRLFIQTSEHNEKLNKILDSIFLSCIEKVDQSIFDLESTTSQGNPSGTPEHTLSLIESTTTAANELTNILNDYISDQAEHSTVITLSINFIQLHGQLLNEIKGITRLAEDDMAEQLVSTTSLAAKSVKSFFDKLLSHNINSVPATSRPDIIDNANQIIQQNFQDVVKLTEKLVVKDASTLEVKNSVEDLGDLVEREMLNAAKAIEEATSRLFSLMNKPADPRITSTDKQIHSSILDSAMAITNAIAKLIQCATQSQQEIVTQGRGSNTKTAFYKKNNRWTEGLISAAKAVAIATNYLVEAADGVIHNTHSLEQLMVACNEVSAATAQLVAASRVKASLHSKSQNQLELASKAVTNASKELVKAVKAIANKQKANSIDLSQIEPHEFKVKEMEQQVQILKLEKELNLARNNLAEMRKHSYHFSNEVDEQ